MSLPHGRGKVGTGRFEGRLKLAKADFDFDVDSVDDEVPTGPLELRGDTIPAGAIVVDSLLVVEEAMTSATTDDATLALSIESANDIQTAVVVDNAALAVGRRAGSAVGAGRPQTTEERRVTATVGVEPLLSGKFSVIVTYIELA